MTSARAAADAPEAGAASPADAAAALTDAYRPIRRVAPPKSPIEGVLAAAGERRVVLADAADVIGCVFGRRAEPPQHLLAPTDLVRRAEGHDLELPWCREPVARLLDLRAAGSRPLAGGELVTLVVSLLRGTREAWEGVAPDAEPPTGRWWLDDGGRPLFAPAEDGGPVAAEAEALLAQAAAHTKDRVLRRLIEQARDALQRPRRLRRALEPLEDALFEACAPRSIERTSHGPGETAGPPVSADGVMAPASGSVGLAGVLERFTDAGFAETMGDAVDRTREAARRALSGGRRLPLLAGGAAAAAVIGLGLLWPSGPDPADAQVRTVAEPGSEMTKRSPAAPAPATSTTAPAPSGSPRPSGSPAAEDVEAAAIRVTGAVAECAAHGDPLCAGVREEAAQPLADGVLRLAAAGGPVLLDDYGDMAVFRLEDPASPGDLVLLQLVRLDGKWVLRSAQAPSGSG